MKISDYFNNYFNNFDMAKHNQVLLTINGQEFNPQIVDYDFTISKIVNSKPTANITIYNVAVSTFSKVEIKCNDTIAFYYEIKSDDEWQESTIELSELDFKVSLKCEDGEKFNIINNILVKGDIITYFLADDKEHKPHKLQLTQDYLFTDADTTEAKLSQIISNEAELSGAFVIEKDKIYLKTAKDKKSLIHPNLTHVNSPTFNLDILNLHYNFGGEDVLLTCLYSSFLRPLLTITLPSDIDSKEMVQYTVTAVETSWNHATGLIQSVTMLAGTRLKQFLATLISKPNNKGESK